MIKILFFIETLDFGGAEKVLRNLVNHMDQSRFDITVQTIWPSEEGRNLAPGIKYKSTYPVKNRVTELLYQFEAAKKLTYPLHIKDNYDIECAFLEFGPTKIIASSTNRKAKKLAWVHCDLSRALPDYAHSSFEAFAKKTRPWYQQYDSIVCVSQTVKDSFDRIFENEFRSVVLYNVLEDDLIRKMAEETVPGLVKRRNTMLAVGTMYPPKNYPRLLRTHEALIRAGIEHDLWILGDGEQRPLLEQYIRDHCLTDSVTLFGFQKNPYPYMKAADMIVCSSNYEGFSSVITEGIILGKAIVTTNCSGMHEILGESEFGLIVENDDDAFLQGLQKLISDTELQKHYTEKAKQRARAFSCVQLTKDVEQFFEQMLSSN